MAQTQKKQQDMGTGDVKKLLLQLMIPAVVAQVVNLLYNIVDRIYIGHISGIGAAALTGVGLFTPILMLLNAFAMLIGSGGAPRTAIAMGQGDKKQAEKIVSNSFTMLLLFSVVLTVVFYAGAPTLLRLFGASDATLPYALSYSRIYILGSVFVLLVLGMNPFITTQGFAKTSMLTTVIGAVINIILDPIFIFGYFGLPAMGTRGAAIATVAGQIIAMLLGLYFNLTKNTDVQFDFKCIKLESYYFKGICTVGIPTIIMQSMSSVMCFGINKLLLDFSTTSTAVFGAYFKLQTFVYMAVFGLNNALIPIVAFNIGAKHAERIKKVIRLSGAYSALIGLVGLIIMEMLPIQLISAFAPSEEMFLLGVTALRILGLSFVFGGISVMTCYALQGFSRGIASLLISALRQVIILLPLASIMGKMMGINGIWWSFLISETVTVVFAIIYLGIAEKKELSFLASMPLEQSIAE